MKRRPLMFAGGAAALLLVVLIVVLAWPRSPVITAHLVNVRYASFERTLPATGTLQRPHLQQLPALVGGNLARFNVQPGQRVAAGQVLAVIANPALVNAADTAHATYLAAAARAQSALMTNANQPVHNRANVVQAEAALETARFALRQAQQDQIAGAESGLGYGADSAAAQRSIANTNFARAQTDDREAARTYQADQDLYAQKAISRDALDRSQAAAQEAAVALDRAASARTEAASAIGRAVPLLRDRAAAAREGVAQAQIALAAARADAGDSKQSEVDAAVADATARRDDWTFAATQVASLQIRAPFAGTVQTIAAEVGDPTRPLQPGDPIAAGAPVVSIALDDSFIVRFNIDEEDVPRVYAGQPALIRSADFGGRTLAGHVVAIDAVARRGDQPSDAVRHVVTTVRLDQRLPFLRDGMSVEVDVIVSRLAHVLAIDPAAIRRDGDGAPYVFAVQAGVARKRPVVLGPMDVTTAVVRSGVTAGETVVAERDPSIVDGTHVRR